MKFCVFFLGAGLAAMATTCAISDTVRTPFGGYFAGKITVALNSPSSAQPLYSGSQTLTGWQIVLDVPATANGAVSFSVVCNDSITPGGTSYSARYAPTSGSAWAETWVAATGTTTIRAMRSTTVPTPAVVFSPSQLTAIGAGAGDCLVFGGTSWAPGACGGGGGSSKVKSVFGRDGDVLAQTGDYTTAQVTESGNLYYTDTRARASITGTAPVSVSGGVVSMAAAASGVSGYLTASDWATFSAKESALTFSGPLSRTTNTVSCPTCVITSGAYADPAWIASLAYSKVTGAPSLAAIATSGSASDLTTGTVATARLGTGTANSTTFLRGDGTWATPAGGGGSGTVTSVSTSTGLFSVSNATTTPSLDVTGTSGGIPYFSASSTLASSAALDAGALIVGGGAGAAPSVLANSSVPNSGELRISTAPAASATRAVFGLGSAIAGGSANGTFWGLNAAAGYSGDLINLQVNGTSFFRVTSAGVVSSGTINVGAGGTNVNSLGLSAATSSTLAVANSGTGTTASTRITGAGGTGSGNFLALRGTSGGTATDQLRINGDQKAVLIGQTVSTSSLASLSLGVFDSTATSGVTRQIIQAGQGQSTTNLLEAKLYNATIGSGTTVFELEADGSFRSIPTATKPTCAAGIRGTFWYVSAASGTKDTAEICAKDAADAYAWRTIY